MKNVKGLLIRSAKPKQFIAGADIEEILSITNPHEASDKAQTGQDLMSDIERLSFPSVAVIDGPCLGGGMELALACTYRVAGEGSHVRLALPEVRLGIVPGFGGTQRMPKVVGLIKALELILSGKNLTSQRAFKAGLVDDIAASQILEDVARSWLLKKKLPKRPTKVSFMNQTLTKLKPVRRFIFKKARAKALKQTSGFYPAPLGAIEVLEATYGIKSAFNYETESRKVGELIAGDVSKALMKLFLATEEIRKEKGPEEPKPIYKVGVVGAGVMGGGICQLIASKGKAIRLKDINTSALAKGLNTMHELNDKERKRRRINKREARNRIARVAPTTDWSGFKRTDLVIEAVIEKMDVKQDVFKSLAEHVSQDTVLATNTSALSVNEIASTTPHPERVIGMHFFNPVHRMPLVEIIKGEETSTNTIATTMNFAKTLGKIPIVVDDQPGFLVNRILGIYLNEASNIAEQGVAISEIEKAMKDFGMPMGPFELLDEIGLDVGEKVGLYLCNSLTHFPKPARLISAIRASERLGKKGGLGFYVHNKKGKTLDTEHIEKILQGLKSEKSDTKASSEYDQLVDRLILIMVNEASRCLDDGVVNSMRDIDIAMVMGTGFPPFRGGLLAHANKIGLKTVHDKLAKLAQSYGDHFKPTRRIEHLMRNDEIFK